VESVIHTRWDVPITTIAEVNYSIRAEVLAHSLDRLPMFTATILQLALDVR
jgi:hypothetical protein